MFGVGGGIIMVPLLMLWARMDQRQAAATSLVAIVPTAVAGATTYGIAGEIDLVAAALVGAGAFAGAPLGAYLLRALPLAWLRWAFIVGMLIAASRLILVEPERGSDIDLSVLISLGLLLLGIVMGVAAGMFGIGGGVIAVPLLIAVFGMGDLAAKVSPPCSRPKAGSRWPSSCRPRSRASSSARCSCSSRRSSRCARSARVGASEASHPSPMTTPATRRRARVRAREAPRP